MFSPLNCRKSRTVYLKQWECFVCVCLLVCSNKSWRIMESSRKFLKLQIPLPLILAHMGRECLVYKPPQLHQISTSSFSHRSPSVTGPTENHCFNTYYERKKRCLASLHTYEPNITHFLFWIVWWLQPYTIDFPQLKLLGMAMFQK